LSLLGKYRKEERDRDDEEGEAVSRRPEATASTASSRQEMVPSAIPNKERKSPIMSFSVASDLRECLKAIRKKKAINLSMWVERTLREAVTREFPEIAEKLLEE
jgi:hypothetical protein